VFFDWFCQIRFSNKIAFFAYLAKEFILMFAYLLLF
jgi:hypothetical protein